MPRTADFDYISITSKIKLKHLIPINSQEFIIWRSDSTCTYLKLSHGTIGYRDLMRTVPNSK